MSNIWSSYKRKQVNISKATFNDEVNRLMEIYYKQLHSLLVKSEQDQDTFNDTYLKLTYNYNPEKNFIEQFKYYFNLLKGAYYRDDRVANYYLSLSDIPDISYKTDEEEVKTEEKISMDKLKQNIQNYANFKKGQKRTNKID